MADKKPTVYAVSYNPKYDYSDAERFGNVVFMKKGIIMNADTDKLLEEFTGYAKTATKNDYLLLSGTVLLCSLASVAFSRTLGEVQILHMTSARGDSGESIHSYQHHYVKSVQEN